MTKGIITIGFRIVLALLVVAVTATVAPAKTYKLTLADSTAPVGLRGIGVKIFVEEIEKHTKGNVKIQVYWGGSLLKAKEILNGIKDGIVDMGYVNPNYYPKQMMVSGAFAIFPKGPSKFRNMSWYFFQCFDHIPAIHEELKELKLKPIYVNTVLSPSVVSTKPFTKFEDFKGKRIRAASRWWLAQLKAAGAVPVSVPWGDCYMALQTGTIDGVYTNIDGEHRTKLDEVAPNVYTCKELWVGVPFFYAINSDKWARLPKEIQDQMMAAGESAAKRFEDLFESEWERTIAEQKKMGCKITHASAEDIAKWVNMPVHKELQGVWIKESSAAGIKNAEDVIAKMEELLAKAIEKDKQ